MKTITNMDMIKGNDELIGIIFKITNLLMYDMIDSVDEYEIIISSNINLEKSHNEILTNIINLFKLDKIEIDYDDDFKINILRVFRNTKEEIFEYKGYKCKYRMIKYDYSSTLCVPDKYYTGYISLKDHPLDKMYYDNIMELLFEKGLKCRELTFSDEVDYGDSVEYSIGIDIYSYIDEEKNKNNNYIISELKRTIDVLDEYKNLLNNGGGTNV